jgi:hypothetical protein
MLAHPKYLVIGAGATALAFVDSIVAHSTATVLMVDAQDRPGGHWNVAYPFVRLHQPSAYYGVNSTPLGRGLRDVVGINAGMNELASGAEVLAYFDEVMQHRLLASGRVQYLPRHWATVRDDGSVEVTSQVTGDSRIVHPGTVVDGTLARTEVPATHPPKYAVAPGVTCIPIGALPQLDRPGVRYTVVGSGKTGIDAVLWLLAHDVAPDRIRWIMPRDAWMLDRGNFQVRADDFDIVVGGLLAQLSAIADASAPDDVIARLEASGQWVRFDRQIMPTAYKCCTVSQPELQQLRRVRDVVRLGHVQSVTREVMTLTHGTIPMAANDVVVDCSACAVIPPPPLRIFEPGRINLLFVRTCQPTFSGAMIGLVASVEPDLEKRNALLQPVASPGVPHDFLRMWAGTIRNRLAWTGHPALEAWMKETRLDMLAIMARTVRPEQTDRIAMLGTLRETLVRAGQRLPSLLAQLAS